MSVGDKDIVPNPDVLIAARRGFGLHGRVKSAFERTKLEDPAFDQEGFEPVEVFAAVAGSDETLDLGAVRNQAAHRLSQGAVAGAARLFSSLSAKVTSACTRLW